MIGIETMMKWNLVSPVSRRVNMVMIGEVAVVEDEGEAAAALVEEGAEIVVQTVMEAGERAADCVAEGEVAGEVVPEVVPEAEGAVAGGRRTVVSTLRLLLFTSPRHSAVLCLSSRPSSATSELNNDSLRLHMLCFSSRILFKQAIASLS